MSNNNQATRDIISRVSDDSWKSELEVVSLRYVHIACWVAAIADPAFAFTDFLNIPDHWLTLLFARLTVAALSLSALYFRKRLRLTTHAVMFVPFFLISLQNAVVYNFMSTEHVLGQNLNFMALMIGGSLFILWPWTYSVIVVVIASAATALFLYLNPLLSGEQFFVHGGMLLATSAIFMIVLINARYNLTVREIKTRLALADSVSILQNQAEEIRAINENLEQLVEDRTSELQAKNDAIGKFTFLTAHKLRAPVASVLGLIGIFRTMPLSEETKEAVGYLDQSAQKLDDIVNSMIRAIEKGETTVNPENEQQH